MFRLAKAGAANAVASIALSNFESLKSVIPAVPGTLGSLPEG